jgi:putative Mn2+ efflux pump MntP
MAEDKSPKFDEYTRNARLKPAFVTIIPLALLGIGLGVKISVIATAIITPLVSLGLTTLVAEFTRDFGKKKEPELYRAWGGKPTTLKLRHTNPSLNTHTRARFHSKLQQLLAKEIPSAHDELENPEVADAIYETAGDLLREKTRDTQRYRLLFEELMSYGFRRNLWALKPIALTLSFLCTAISTGVLIFESYNSVHDWILFGTTALNWLLLICWLSIINPEWVRQSADEYANRLLSALDTF